MFDTFEMYTGCPIWDISSCDMMRKYSWTRLAWCNQRKVAVYLASLDIRAQYGEACLGVLVLTPGACVWADSVDFSELLTYFGTIVHSCIEVDNSRFTEYAVYAMAMFIDDAFEEHGDTAGALIDCLNVTDPGSDEDAHNEDLISSYQKLQEHFKEPWLNDRCVRYFRMMQAQLFPEPAVTTLKRLTHQSLGNKDGLFLDAVPALDNIILDYNETFIKNAEKASEKSEKKPKRTTNVRELLWNSYPHICGLCGEQINSIDEMHVDHIIPLSRGGKDILANLQLTHARCNMDKGNTLFEESEE